MKLQTVVEKLEEVEEELGRLEESADSLSKNRLRRCRADVSVARNTLEEGVGNIRELLDCLE